MARMSAQGNEQFRVIYLDGKFAIMGEQLVAEGTINQAAVCPRKVMEHALKSRASNLVCVHNHPDSKVTPSEFDKTLTCGLFLAERTMSISVYDPYYRVSGHLLQLSRKRPAMSLELHPAIEQHYPFLSEAQDVALSVLAHYIAVRLQVVHAYCPSVCYP